MSMMEQWHTAFFNYTQTALPVSLPWVTNSRSLGDTVLKGKVGTADKDAPCISCIHTDQWQCVLAYVFLDTALP